MRELWREGCAVTTGPEPLPETARRKVETVPCPRCGGRAVRVEVTAANPDGFAAHFLADKGYPSGYPPAHLLRVCSARFRDEL